MDTLTAINPIDGRYRKHTEPLARFFSEAALIRYRIIVEGEYLIALRRLSSRDQKIIRKLYTLSDAQPAAVREIEKTTDHDVKAVEYFIKQKLRATSLKKSLEWVHFGLTSEDINNIAYALMLSESVREEMLPALKKISKTLTALAHKHKTLPMLARTHGQPASPTTFGKEMAVFASRLQRQIDQLQKQEILVKLSGATGNWNAHHAAFPKTDWIAFSKKFVATLARSRKANLKLNLLTTQIEPHDSYAELFDTLRRINVILIGLDQDIWRYISDEWIVQQPQSGTIGSSAMPHKVNPIKFENSEGNLGLANALLTHLSQKLPVSRLQRDLSDSTVQRNFGTAFAHSLIAYNYLLTGLANIKINEQKIREDLAAHPEVIAEAIQTILRREGVALPYEKLKALTRGKKVTLAHFADFIDTLPVSPKLKKELRSFTPQNYTGLASKLVK